MMYRIQPKPYNTIRHDGVRTQNNHTTRIHTRRAPLATRTRVLKIVRPFLIFPFTVVVRGASRWLLGFLIHLDMRVVVVAVDRKFASLEKHTDHVSAGMVGVGNYKSCV